MPFPEQNADKPVFVPTANELTIDFAEKFTGLLGKFIYCVDESELVNGTLVVLKPPSKQEIARIIGASREMVSRVIKDLQLRGCIRLEKRKIFILDQFSINKSASDI